MQEGDPVAPRREAGIEIQPVVWKRTFPTGDSSVLAAPTFRTTASSPEGPQSANSAFSTSSRGVPPAVSIRASVPRIEKARVQRGSSSSARTPAGDTAISRAAVSPSDCASIVPAGLLNTSSPFPSKLALKMTRPSGANRAARTAPRR